MLDVSRIALRGDTPTSAAALIRDRELNCPTETKSEERPILSASDVPVCVGEALGGQGMAEHAAASFVGIARLADQARALSGLLAASQQPHAGAANLISVSTLIPGASVEL
jgi:hypothetical protein